MSGRNPEPLDYAEAVSALRKARVRIEDAEAELEKRIEKKAEAAATHRKMVAKAFTTHRTEGKGVTEAEVLAKGDAAEAEWEMVLAEGLAKAAFEALEDRRGDRASLHRICEWSMKVSAFGDQREQIGRAA